MPRKTRILHGEDEYLFVESPGDADGPALLLFARPTNPRAVPAGRAATHQSEHGLWVAVARFDGKELLLAPESPDGLGDRLKNILPKYAEVRRDRTAAAKNAWYWIAVGGSALHGLHPAQPGGVLLKLWRTEADARRVLAEIGAEGSGSVQSTGDLREFLELRAEEGFGGAWLEPGEHEQIVFFCLDEERHLQFMKIAADDDEDVKSELLDAQGRWQPYEGDGELEPFVDAEAWDRLLVRSYGDVPFFGCNEGWRCFALFKDGAPVAVVDPDADGRARMVALFHDPAAADDFRSKQKLGRASVERVSDLAAFLERARSDGHVVRLHPGDHRVRGGTLWIDRGEVVLDSFSGIWRSRDGRHFERAA
jgi:hypothetical protein